MKKNKKTKKSTSVSKSMVIIAIVIVSVAFFKVFLMSTLAQLNYEVEKQKKEIEQQEKTNESLQMAINELASLTKIEEVAKDQGLSYNNNNIKAIKTSASNE
jgi:cell division protein FtsL